MTVTVGQGAQLHLMKQKSMYFFCSLLLCRFHLKGFCVSNLKTIFFVRNKLKSNFFFASVTCWHNPVIVLAPKVGASHFFPPNHFFFILNTFAILALSLFFKHSLPETIHVPAYHLYLSLVLCPSFLLSAFKTRTHQKIPF